VVTVVKDSLENPNCPLDVGEFSEMLSAYFPQFGDIPPNLVLKWVEQVHLLLSHRKLNMREFSYFMYETE